MRVLGLDIGSRSIDAVWLDGERIVDWAVADSGYDPGSASAVFVERDAHDVVVVTGYGRRVAKERFGCTAITEITAYGIGAAALFPEAASVLDIGGQDTKVISLGQAGRVVDFEMNDKCAAGTGKFLEVMARALGFSLEEMAAVSRGAESGIAISSMCTVFAESEVTGLVHRGEDRARIARGLHDAIAKRTLGSLKRIDAQSPLVFAGGVAKNPAMVDLITGGFAGEVLVPDESQIVGAYGAALSAARS
ncbi:MAG: acyl-CoA dehydratase activase [Coriobacteriia bacterium]|nr:acyl-CoA dehydratase activase [Coriobacteriia bacterium]